MPECMTCRGSGHADGARCPACNLLWIECATCAEVGTAPDFIHGYADRRYRLACGHQHHLNPDEGGCRTWKGGPRDSVPPVPVTRTQLDRPTAPVGRDARRTEHRKRRTRYGRPPV